MPRYMPSVEGYLGSQHVQLYLGAEATSFEDAEATAINMLNKQVTDQDREKYLGIFAAVLTNTEQPGFNEIKPDLLWRRRVGTEN